MFSYSIMLMKLLWLSEVVGNEIVQSCAQGLSEYCVSRLSGKRWWRRLDGLIECNPYIAACALNKLRQVRARLDRWCVYFQKYSHCYSWNLEKFNNWGRLVLFQSTSPELLICRSSVLILLSHGPTRFCWNTQRHWSYGRHVICNKITYQELTQNNAAR